MIGAYRAAWTMLARPILLWPGLGAIVVFTITAITFTFSTAAAPGGSRFTDPPTTLADLAAPDALAQLVGRPVMITGTVLLAIAILHITTQYSSGLIHVALVYQPRRGRWLVGNWLALASAATVASIVGAAVAVVISVICATVWGVDTAAWSDGAGAAIAAAGNLTLGMVAFAIAGSALAVWLRSPIAALASGLVYALFEGLLTGASPVGKGLLPSSAFATVATSGFNGGPYIPALIATALFMLAIVTGTIGLLNSRNVTD